MQRAKRVAYYEETNLEEGGKILMKIKKGDNVKVLSGNDKDKTGEVLEVIPKEDKIVVKGVNIRKKHVKARKQGEESGILSIECSIPTSKVNVICPKCGKTTKIGYSIEKDNKVRICKKCGAKIK
jgi:large subunit ribosomal protein L24